MPPAESRAARGRGLSIESHAIDFVPSGERYGTPRRLFTIWASANLTILGVALGTMGVASGLGLVWVLGACALGNAVGTVVMAAHSAQGPRLGVPQMIQSRAQFGVVGAAVPLVAVAAMYLLYCAANGIIIPPSMGELLHVGPRTALLVFAAATALITFCGYELIHRLAGIFSVISTVFFAAAAVLLFREHLSPLAQPLTSSTHFEASVFAVTATQAAAWSLTYGPYVADYSRYLPANVSPAQTFWYTAAGNFFGSQLVMSFGAFLARVDPHAAKNPGGALAALFGAARPLALLVICVGVILGNVLNLYSAYLSSVTIFSGWHGGRTLRPATKLALIAVLSTLAAVISLAAGADFDTYFADALNVMVYLLIPWSAINLVDFYFVCHGHYDIDALYRVEGRYGAWQWRTLAVFGVGLLVQIPFMSLTYYHGPVARATGADFAWLPGLLVGGLLYFLVRRQRVRPVRRALF